jgi:hypothetical protein
LVTITAIRWSKDLTGKQGKYLLRNLHSCQSITNASEGVLLAQSILNSLLGITLRGYDELEGYLILSSYFSRSYVLTTIIAIKEVQILAKNFNVKNKATRQGWKKNL